MADRNDTTLPQTAPPPTSPAPLSPPDRVPNRSFRDLLENGTRDEKRLAVYYLLRSLVGESLEREYTILDDQDFGYACLLPIGYREYLRFLEEPERLIRLQKGAVGPKIPWSEVKQMLESLAAQHHASSVST